jgi:hypothetical protein
MVPNDWDSVAPKRWRSHSCFAGMDRGDRIAEEPTHGMQRRVADAARGMSLALEFGGESEVV